MAWLFNNDIVDTVNLINVNTGPELMFYLKALLKKALWTVPSSSDGSTYNSSGDQISHAGTGPGGMNNNNAWFRIQDPGARREFVFQRGTAGHYSWAGKYSALAKFVTGSPSNTVTPTATDQQGVIEGSTALNSIFPSTGTNMIGYMAAQNVPDGDVYPFYLSLWNPSTVPYLQFFVESIQGHNVLDVDPIAISFNNSPITLTNFTTTSTSTSQFYGWMKYGEVDQHWGTYHGYGIGAGGTSLVMPNQSIRNQFSTSFIPIPILLSRSASQGFLGYKGWAKNMLLLPNSSWTYPEYYKVGSSYYVASGIFALPWPDSRRPLY